MRSGHLWNQEPLVEHLMTERSSRDSSECCSTHESWSHYNSDPCLSRVTFRQTSAGWSGWNAQQCGATKTRNPYTALIAIGAASRYIMPCTRTLDIKRRSWMSEEQNKAIVRRFFEEVWNQQKENVIDEIFAPTLVLNGQSITRDALKQCLATRRTAFSDIHVTVDDQVAEGEKVSTRRTWRAIHRVHTEMLRRPASR